MRVDPFLVLTIPASDRAFGEDSATLTMAITLEPFFSHSGVWESVVEASYSMITAQFYFSSSESTVKK